MDEQPNNVTRSRNHCCRGKAVTITYYKRVFVAFGIQYAKRMRRTYICGLFRSTIFNPNYLLNGTARFSNKGY